MSKTIDLSRGYEALSEQDKLYLAARGRLPKEHITDGIRKALDVSGVTSTVAYGAHTGTVATMTDAELKAELEKRAAAADNAYKGDNPKKALMPDLDNPNSERLKAVNETHETFAGEKGAKLAASERMLSGPVAPSLGAPGVTSRQEVGPVDLDDDDDDDDDDEVLAPEDYADVDTKTPNDVLRGEIVRRNEGRAEEDKLSLDGNKAQLVATLQADDADEDEDDEE